jgi:hypothetical protein
MKNKKKKGSEKNNQKVGNNKKIFLKKSMIYKVALT